jgi:hypothetical protein
VWAIGANRVGRDYGIWHWTGTTWNSVAGLAGVAIAVDPTGKPWVVTSLHRIYHWNGGGWTPMPGTATDVAVGASGAVWAIGANRVGRDYGIWHWTGTTWTPVTGTGVAIAVDPTGKPWVVTSLHRIYHWNGGGWTPMPGTATDVAVGASGAVWAIGANRVGRDYGIWYWTGTTWTAVTGAAVAIAVDPRGNPWIVTSTHKVFSFLPSLPFPAGVSANHRYLVDGNGAPYLLVGDSPQCLSANLSLADINYFYADREQHGFNAAWVNLLCGPYTGGRSDYSTYDGIVPFTTPGDLSTPNPAYFARMDAMVHLAAAHGITLLLDPAETGSFTSLLRNNGVSKDFAYGAYLGTRYRHAPNIIWLSGNDYQAVEWAVNDPYTTAVARGLRSTDRKALQTIELDYPVSLSTDDPNWAGHVDLNAAYTYTPTYAEVLNGYDHRPTLPVFLVEANYEFENNTGGLPAGGDTLRRQEYWTMLRGATGQLYGNHYTWGFQFGAWKNELDTVGASQVAIMTHFFTSLPWFRLVPDQDHTLVTSGYGTATTTGLVADSDYAPAAVTADGSLAVVYLPTPRTITVDMTRFRGPVTARWFDPTNGAYTPAAGRVLPNTGTQQFTPGSANSQGDPDWVLVLSTGSTPAAQS